VEREKKGSNLVRHLEEVGDKHLSIPCITLQQFPGYRVVETRGLVSGVAVMGTNAFRDIAASFKNVVGGRAGGYEASFKEGRLIATSEMQREAFTAGANAVLGVSIDYETVNGQMMIVTVSGTSVVLEKLVTRT
jgi:uncharacterized protein YbjQ (UPF0145 family)